MRRTGDAFAGRSGRVIIPGVVGIAPFGSTLSCDEFGRTPSAAATRNTLPLEIIAITTNVTTSALFASGTLPTFSAALTALVSRPRTARM
jgi:putative spermidine/putrescine transport system permease protein